MNRNKWLKVCSTGVVSSLLGIGALFAMAGTASAAPASRTVAQTTDLVAAAMAFGDAYNARDIAKLMDMTDPSFQDVSNAGPSGQQVSSRTDFINGSAQGPQVTLSNCKQTGANTVSCDTILSGTVLPPLPHPWSETDVLTFSNGKITRLDETLSDQTAQELAVFTASQPGMPTTGSPDNTLPLATMLAGLLLAGAGLATRRAYSRSRWS